MITMRDFLLAEFGFLLDFQKYWEQENKADPESFPAKMDIGEWMEQLMFFEGHNLGSRKD